MNGIGWRKLIGTQNHFPSFGHLFPFLKCNVISTCLVGAWLLPCQISLLGTELHSTRPAALTHRKHSTELLQAHCQWLGHGLSLIPACWTERVCALLGESQAKDRCWRWSLKEPKHGKNAKMCEDRHCKQEQLPIQLMKEISLAFNVSAAELVKSGLSVLLRYWHEVSAPFKSIGASSLTSLWIAGVGLF